MDAKKVLVIALMVTLFAGFANAITSITVAVPAANELFLPNLGERFIDFNFRIVDSNSLNSIHRITVDFNVGTDTNYAIFTDLNLSSTNCDFSVAEVWTTPGVNCKIRFVFPSGVRQITTGTHVLDFNVHSYTQLDGPLGIEDGNAVVTFRVDNRFVDTSVEALLNIMPLVLIAAMLVGIVLLGLGAIGGKTMIIIVVGAIVSIIAVIVLSGILGVLTP